MSRNKYKRPSGRRKQQPGPLILLAAGGLLLMIGAVFALNQSSAPKAALEVSGTPRLRVDQEKIDLGNVKLGQTVQASFQITNVGDQALRFAEAPFIEVKEGC